LDFGDRSYLREKDRENGMIFECSPIRFFTKAGMPRIDVYQTDKDIIIVAEIPGALKENLRISIDEYSIRLSSLKTTDSRLNDRYMMDKEKHAEEFSRTIPVPFEIQSDNANVDYRDGILYVVIPRAESYCSH
jgi:HSP20 family protein